MDWWQFENECFAGGLVPVCGVDEAGRGPFAGPVYAAAVILPCGWTPEGLNDSKKLTPKARDELFEIITVKSVAYGIGSASAEEIAALNIEQAVYLAMNRAIEALGVTSAISLIDGNRAGGVKHPNRCIIKGDQKSASVAAASVLAKVSRDRYMLELHEQYPEYNFARHKGYGTKEHQAAILEHGPCPQHRMNFLKKLYARASKDE